MANVWHVVVNDIRKSKSDRGIFFFFFLVLYSFILFNLITNAQCTYWLDVFFVSLEVVTVERANRLDPT